MTTKFVLSLVSLVLFVHICLCDDFPWISHGESCRVTTNTDCGCYLEDGLPVVLCSGRNLISLPVIDANEYNNTLAVLDLSNNNLNRYVKPFIPGVAIHKFDLSYNDPPISSIYRFSIDRSIEEMKSLKLQGNAIRTFPYFTGLTNLEELDLSYNKLYSLNNHLLKVKMPRLRILNLIGNHIFIIYGFFPSSLEQLYLGLSDKSLSSIPVALFDKHASSSLEAFSIVSSERSSFRNYARHLRSLPPVEFFQVSHRALTDDILNTIDIPRCNQSLNVIDLSHNNLTSFPGSFVGAFVKLEILMLESNKITIVHRVASPANLRTINLSNNRIHHLDQGAFTHLSHLVTLDLSSNNLSTVFESSFSSDLDTGNTHLKLTNNPFVCSCDIKWLVALIKHQLTTGVGPLNPFDVHNLYCQGNGVWTYMTDLYDVYVEGTVPAC